MIRVRHGDLFDQAFHIPTMFDKIAGKPIEQFGMTGKIPLGAKITQRFDDARAEQLRPNAVHKDAGRERVFW
jgi:hypothetical protein